MSARVLSNLESVGDMIGALKGIEAGLDDDAYMETIIKKAHGKAATAFDIAAAATAATGHLKHVFEYGTQGITEGPIQHSDPTHPAARLWTHRIMGRGGAQDISYSFRPAMSPNPRPTTRSTGVPSKYLARLSRRKYVFWNKAFVMETGQTVEIKSKQPHGLLFVPTPGSNEPRNYIMWHVPSKGVIRATPGRTTQGNFTAFWMRYWSNEGAAIMENDMKKTISTDIEVAMAQAAKRSASVSVKPVQTTNVNGAVERGRALIKKFFNTRKNERSTPAE